MKLKQNVNFNKIIKKYWLWILLFIAFLIIPVTNSKYLLQKSVVLNLSLINIDCIYKERLL